MGIARVGSASGVALHVVVVWGVPERLVTIRTAHAAHDRFASAGRDVTDLCVVLSEPAATRIAEEIGIEERRKGKGFGHRGFEAFVDKENRFWPARSLPPEQALLRSVRNHQVGPWALAWCRVAFWISRRQSLERPRGGPMSSLMERPATIAMPGQKGRDGWALDALYRAGFDSESGGAVIAPPHPLYGGSMDSPVVTELAFACEKVGLASLRFDWRGVGASAGAPSGSPDDALEDYSAALDFLEASVSAPLVAAGYACGAATAAAAGARTTVRRLVLVAPPPAMLDASVLVDFKGKIFIGVGEQDAISSAVELASMVDGLDHVTFETLDDTDHFFMTGSGLRQIGQRVGAWLEG